MTKPLSTNEKARRDCVRHWKRMLKLTREDIKEMKEAPSQDACAFCNLYIVSRCAGCPIRQRTEQIYCEGTPYIDAIREYRYICHGNDLANLPKFRKAVRAEIKFLESLEIE